MAIDQREWNIRKILGFTSGSGVCANGHYFGDKCGYCKYDGSPMPQEERYLRDLFDRKPSVIICKECLLEVEGEAFIEAGEIQHRKCWATVKIKKEYPYTCPVCEGEGKTKGNHPEPAKWHTSGPIGPPAKCKQCHGRGCVKKEPIKVISWITE